VTEIAEKNVETRAVLKIGLNFMMMITASWYRLFLDRMTLTWLVEEFLTSYRTRNSANVFKTANHWTLSW
jgi:hypothetical protein